MRSAVGAKRGRRRLAFLVVLLACFGGLLWPLLPTEQSAVPQPYAPYETSALRGEYSLDATGTLTANEVQSGELQFSADALYRVWDITSPTNPNVRLIPQINAVTLNGEPTGYETTWLGDGRYLQLSVPGPIAAGKSALQINYTVPGMLAPESSGASANIEMVDATWLVFLNKVSATLSSTGAISSASCVNGALSTINCSVSGLGTKKIAAIAVEPGQNSGFYLQARVDGVTPAAQISVPWSTQWDRILGLSVSAAVILIFAALLMALAGFAWPMLTRERPPGFPTVFEPPKDMGPAQVAYCLWESPGRHVVAATLLHLRDLGLVRFEKNEYASLTFTRTADASAWKQADSQSRMIAESVGLTERGATMQPTMGRKASSQFANAESKALESMRIWSRAAGLSRIGRAQLIGRMLWWTCLAAAAVSFVGFFGPTLWGLPFAAFVIFGFRLTEVGYLMVRTEAGKRAWSQAGGFSRFLATPSNEARIQYMVDRQMRPEFMAYALAFGVAATWAEGYLGMSPILRTAVEDAGEIGDVLESTSSGADPAIPSE